VHAAYPPLPVLRVPGRLVRSPIVASIRRHYRVAELPADSTPRPWHIAARFLMRLHMLVVLVHPSALQPHHLKAEAVERGTYVRLLCSCSGTPVTVNAQLLRLASDISAPDFQVSG